MSLLKHPKSIAPLLISDIISCIQRDSIGRKRHPNQNKGLPKVYEHVMSIRLDDETYEQLKKKAGKRGMGKKIREYIEWGLENEE